MSYKACPRWCKIQFPDDAQMCSHVVTPTTGTNSNTSTTDAGGKIIGGRNEGGGTREGGGGGGARGGGGGRGAGGGVAGGGGGEGGGAGDAHLNPAKLNADIVRH